MCLVIHNYTRFFIACQPPFCKIVQVVHTPPYSCLFFRRLHNACAYRWWQLLLWLTVNLPNLCIYVYTCTPTPAMAPAYPLALCVMCVHVCLCLRIMWAWCVHEAQHNVSAMRCVPRCARQSTVMVSVAITICHTVLQICHNGVTRRGGAYVPP